MSCDFAIIDKEFEQLHEDRKSWAIGNEHWPEYKKEYLLKKAALSELIDLFKNAGEENFLELADTAVLNDENYCSPVDLFEMIQDEKLRKKLEESYYTQVSELNRGFLSSLLPKIPIETTIKFLSFSVGTNNMSKELIDNMNLSPDAPIKYRESLKKGDWTGEGEKETREEILWHNVEEKETAGDIIKEADAFALNGKFENSIRMYENLIENLAVELDTEMLNVVLFKLVLCCIAVDDIILAGEKLRKYYSIILSERRNILSKIIETVENYDMTNFVLFVNEYNEKHNIDNWTKTILLKIKNNYFGN